MLLFGLVLSNMFEDIQIGLWVLLLSRSVGFWRWRGQGEQGIPVDDTTARLAALNNNKETTMSCSVNRAIRKLTF